MVAPYPRRTEAGVRYAASILGQDVNDPRVKALQWVHPGARVLEIGCGHGAVTRLLRDTLDCKVVAVDVDPGCAASLADVAERFVCGDVADASVQALIAGDYDYVLLMDVLEHMPSPETTLAALAGCVGAGARFLITLPNFVVWHVRMPLLLGHFEYQETGTLDRTHLRFFSPESAQRLLTGAGYEIARVEGTWNVPFLGNVWSLAQLAGAEAIEEKIERRFPGLKGELVKGIFAAQRALNRVGWIHLMDKLGHAFLQAAPGLFTNHVVLLAAPAKLPERP